MNTNEYAVPNLVINKTISHFQLTPELIVVKQSVSSLNDPDTEVTLESVFETKEGKYVGPIDYIENMPFIKNISEFHYRTPTSTICSIGFSKEESKWYGWSHRAWYSFGIGSTVKVGDCAYKPKDAEDLKRWARAFYVDEGVIHEANEFNYTCEFEEFQDGIHEGWQVGGFWVKYKYTRLSKETNEILFSNTMSTFVQYPEVYGRGEWTAQTLEDAKQMATDFVTGVN